jgi:asparagine synthase (glutamine-hydrolysing)
LCGIAGAISTQAYGGGLDAKVKLATNELLHRGPDGSGQTKTDLSSGATAVLGHTRLAIIDLTNAGAQPYISPESDFVLTFNGEIYNYLELRQELEQLGVSFQSTSDTEVLLHSLIHWGENALQKLEGMFAFVFVDKKTNTVLMARDPFGIKPLYYHLGNSVIGFASEPRSLRKIFPELNQVDEKIASDFLVFGYSDMTENTFFKGIVSLLPGHYLKMGLDNSTLSVQPVKYWNPNVSKENDISFDEAKSRFKELLFESVELHMRSDVAVGAALSGGIDSSSIASVVRHLYPSADLHTFSYIASDPRISEESWVDQIINWTGATGHKVSIDKNLLFESDLDELIVSQGEPFSTLSIYAQFKVFQLAKEVGIKVTLDGQGADEFLAGYHGFPEGRISSLMQTGKWLEIPKFVKNWDSWPGRSAKSLAAVYFADNFPIIRRSSAFISAAQKLGLIGNHNLEFFESQTRSLAGSVPQQYKGSAKGFKGRKLTQALFEALGPKRLTSLLRFADRNSMHSSIESRVPFLNKKLVEFTLSLPEHYLLSDKGETKHILRHALKGIVPDPILNRKDKIGFEAATPGWGKGSAVLKQVASSLEDIPLISSKAAKQAVNEVVSGDRPLDSNLWRVVNFARWYQLEKLNSQ